MRRALCVPETPFDEDVLCEVRLQGGFFNAHSHLDRARTFDARYFRHADIDPEDAWRLTLGVKQNLVRYLHSGDAYQYYDLYTRMRVVLEDLVASGVTRAISFIDVTPDIGLDACEVALALKAEFSEHMQLEIALSPIFGFPDDEHWELYREAASYADILGGLPEKDEGDYRIGFEEHIRKILELGIALDKPVHFHLDQMNVPWECGTETLVRMVDEVGAPELAGTGEQEPSVWAVHAISPSAYSERRFLKLLEGLSTHHIGVVCCPTAALSMRQYRNAASPVHNSIARVWEMLDAGVQVRLGTDNIEDIFVRNCSGSMLREVNELVNATRFYHTGILAKIAAGVPLEEDDRAFLRQYLTEEQKAQRRAIR